MKQLFKTSTFPYLHASMLPESCQGSEQAGSVTQHEMCWMCVLVYVWVCVCWCVYVWVCVCWCVYVWVCVCVCLRVGTLVYACVRACVHVCACVFVYMCVCMCVAQDYRQNRGLNGDWTVGEQSNRRTKWGVWHGAAQQTELRLLQSDTEIGGTGNVQWRNA